MIVRFLFRPVSDSCQSCFSIADTRVMYKKGIGQAIREIRLAQNMTQEELIEKADLSRSQLYYIESGKTTPRLPTIHSICTALGLSFVDFVHYIYQYSPGSATPSISSMEAPGATIG